jgi:hypothetical protein
MAQAEPDLLNYRVLVSNYVYGKGDYGYYTLDFININHTSAASVALEYSKSDCATTAKAVEDILSSKIKFRK